MNAESKMILAVAEAIVTKAQVSWVMTSDGKPTQMWINSKA